MNYTPDQIEEFKRKANAYDELEKQIAEYYGEENEEGEYEENEDSDLSTIGEIAASHFGFL